jgi:hypothetical protein
MADIVTNNTPQTGMENMVIVSWVNEQSGQTIMTQYHILVFCKFVDDGDWCISGYTPASEYIPVEKNDVLANAELSVAIESQLAEFFAEWCNKVKIELANDPTFMDGGISKGELNSELKIDRDYLSEFKMSFRSNHS